MAEKRTHFFPPSCDPSGLLGFHIKNQPVPSGFAIAVFPNNKLHYISSKHYPPPHPPLPSADWAGEGGKGAGGRRGVEGVGEVGSVINLLANARGRCREHESGFSTIIVLTFGYLERATSESHQPNSRV